MAEVLSLKLYQTIGILVHKVKSRHAITTSYIGNRNEHISIEITKNKYSELC